MIQLQVIVPSSAFVYERKKLRAVMRRAGAEIAAVARALVKRSTGGGATYHYKGYRLGAYQASAPGQPPVSVSGTLAKSIKSRPFRPNPDRDGAIIRDSAFYALFLEAGARGGGGKKRLGRNKRGAPTTTRVLLPRPFLSTALTQRQASIEKRIKDAVLQDIAFKRLKA